MDTNDFQILLTQSDKQKPFELLCAIDTFPQSSKDFVVLLLQWRTQKGLSQAEAATKLGVSQSYLTHIENNTQIPSPKFAQRVRELLKDAALQLPTDE